MRKFTAIFVVSVFIFTCVGCSNSSDKTIKTNAASIDTQSKNITIKIIDAQNDEQHYLVQIMTNGKQTKDMAVLPESKFVITDDKKEAKTEFYVGVTYTIRVSKTTVKSTEEYFKKPKTGHQTPEEEKPLVQEEFIPSAESNTLEIKVNPS
ncbi:hypothetical protein [Ectobacillus panaciterrae]|uniref:hypothetical protein n=1 Tax=Ectobacillus panaciterrae TaxID=363872 RepID=UPI00048E4C83|nr:hypothetical protein [Ectobacillus panaciterrae]